ncbi:fumarylacetoacetate hydrolase family protein [Sphingobium algorifonticola]|uniref:FAA hydrolase family protein n=1 Tax=Sphingobium algorifonticola TaxID=2008318 RepID=A0A437JA00_9SPHN|nr:fumarylacetoacetate hydrolase family protein [Sphingobium algorifonticola]RVT42328.1 FAA hydrolase family protein [Sphingobium algorifonticola]
MRLISYAWQGKASFGAVKGDGVVDLAPAFADRAADLRDFVGLDALDEARAYVEGATPVAALTDITFLPVIPNPDKIIMAAVNYDDHRIEAGRDRTENPVLFLRLAESQTGHGAPLKAPPESHHFDYEGEIAVVIGKGGRRIARDQALDHVAGYSIYNDASIRDWQRHTSQFTAGKNWNDTGAFGPWLVTPDEIGDYRDMALETRLNGQVLQSCVASDMIFDVEALIAYISTWTHLRHGDVIVTGTCGGVGFKRVPPIFMRDGDVVEVEVSKIGILRNPIANETV